jgi:hypothetical protein
LTLDSSSAQSLLCIATNLPPPLRLRVTRITRWLAKTFEISLENESAWRTNQLGRGLVLYYSLFTFKIIQ